MTKHDDKERKDLSVKIDALCVKGHLSIKEAGGLQWALKTWENTEKALAQLLARK